MEPSPSDILGYLVGGEALARERVPIPRQGLTLGRDPKAVSHVVDNAMVSRAHIKVEVSSDGTVLVSDLGSTNGTFHNGKKIEAPAVLATGDRITLDAAGKLLLVYETAKAPAKGVALAGPAAAPAARPATPGASSAVVGVEWMNPTLWLAEAWKAEGKDPAPASGTRVVAPSSQAQGEADFAIYEEARRLFEGSIRAGRKELEPQLAALLSDEAILLEHLNNVSEAVLRYDRVMEIYQRWIEEGGHVELANELASACSNKAGVVWSVGDHRAALTLCDHAVEIRDWLVNHEGKEEYRGDLARIKAKRAVVFMSLGNITMAQTEGREAIGMLKDAANKTARADLQAELVWATHALGKLLQVA